MPSPVKAGAPSQTDPWLKNADFNLVLEPPLSYIGHASVEEVGWEEA